ncbi:hypothetical protein Tco_0278052 [Tanacetum coccineum]
MEEMEIEEIEMEESDMEEIEMEKMEMEEMEMIEHRWFEKMETDFHISVGITHQKSVPRTPQQNGIAKDKMVLLWKLLGQF